MIAIILGDVHLSKGTSSLGRPGLGSALNSRIIDQFNILEWTLNQAIDCMANSIIITGDVFEDAKPNPTIISLFISWLKKCTDNDVNVHIIVGNHDILRSGQFYMSALDIISAADIDNVFIYKQMSTLHMQGVSFTLMPFRDRRSFNTDSNVEALKIMQDKMPYELAGIDSSSIKVVIGHLAIEGSIPIGDEIDDMQNEIFCPISMFNGYDYVWMGHVHKPQVMSKSPYIAHIGSMDLSNFSESDHKKHIVIFDSSKKIPYKNITIPSRPLNQISICVPTHIKNTTNYVSKEIDSLKKEMNKSIVRLNILIENIDTPNIDRSVIEKKLIDLGVFHISRINEERKIDIIKKNTLSDEIDTTVNETTAIKMYAEANVDDEYKNEFISLANEIIKECSDNK